MSVRAQSRILFVFLLISIGTFSQKKVIKQFSADSKEISISTEGLDDFVLENSKSKFIEVQLNAENPNEQHIIVSEKNSETQIKFKIPVFKNEDKVFRKYITKRLKRATATIKVPKNIDISIFGENINITSKSYQGNVRVFIENGIVKLDTIQQNLELKMYAGNIFGTFEKHNLKANSKYGKIKIDNDFYQKEYQKKEVFTTKKISIITIKGNIFLTTK